MTTTCLSAARLTFTAHRHFEDGVWWADSPQIPGFTAIADDPAELFRLVAEAPDVYLGWPCGEYTTVLMHKGA